MLTKVHGSREAEGSDSRGDSGVISVSRGHDLQGVVDKEEGLQIKKGGPKAVTNVHVFEGEGGVDTLVSWGPGLAESNPSLPEP